MIFSPYTTQSEMKTLSYKEGMIDLKGIDYLQPACNFLMYTGSKNTEHTLQVHDKCGRPRSQSPEQELFMVLVRLRCGLLNLDIANRF